MRNIFLNAGVLSFAEMKASEHLKGKEKCLFQIFRCGTKCGKRFSFRTNLLLKIYLLEQKKAQAVEKQMKIIGGQRALRLKRISR